MRKLLTSAIASFALATAFVGSASAATFFDDTQEGEHVGNQALQDQLERDDQQARDPLTRPPLGVVISPGDQTAEAPGRAAQEGSSPSSSQNPDQAGGQAQMEGGMSSNTY